MLLVKKMKVTFRKMLFGFLTVSFKGGGGQAQWSCLLQEANKIPNEVSTSHR
jgi:hypothetical protein